MIDYGYGVSFRPIESSDIEQMREWRNDKRVWQWCRQNDLISNGMQERWYIRQDQDPSIHMYAVIKDNEMVGVTGLTSHDLGNRNAELSLYIGPEHQKGGIGEATFRTLIDHGFKNLNLHVIWCECFTGNPVISLVQKVGFVYGGIRRDFYYKDGEYLDAEIFTILENEWRSSRP